MSTTQHQHAKIPPMPPDVDPDAIARNLASIRQRIADSAKRAGRDPNEITLVAVSKTFPPEAIRAAHAAGLRHFGENRIQERESKRDPVADLEATWHLVGHLQSNKVRRAVHLFDRIDSVDSIALAQKIDRAASEENKRLGVLIEIHMGEATKTGVSESDLPPLADAFATLRNLDLRGFMTIPPYAEKPETTRPYFAKLCALSDQTAQRIGHVLPILSMGMSHDFEIAIAEGATEVRIGSALFGRRE